MDKLVQTIELHQQVPNTLGVAVLRASDGEVVKTSGEMQGDSAMDSLGTLYQVVLDTGGLLLGSK